MVVDEVEGRADGVEAPLEVMRWIGVEEEVGIWDEASPLVGARRREGWRMKSLPPLEGWC